MSFSWLFYLQSIYSQLLSGYKLVGPEQMSCRKVQGVHRTNSRPGRFPARMAQNPLQIVEHYATPEVLLVEAVFTLLPVENRFGQYFVADKGAAQKNAVGVFQHH